MALKKCPIADFDENFGEIEILRSCDHPQILKFFGHYTDEESLYVRF